MIPSESQQEPGETDLAGLKAAAVESDVRRIKVAPPPEPRTAIPPAPEPVAARAPAAVPTAPQPGSVQNARPVIVGLKIEAKTSAELEGPQPTSVHAPQSLDMRNQVTGATAPAPSNPSLAAPLVPLVSAGALAAPPALKPAPHEMATDLPDPFAVMPAAIWYVRPPQGGQYGPATTAVMRTWVEDGRVPPESHVWAEGWPEWRRAVSVIPSAMLEAAGKRLQGTVSLTANLTATTESTSSVAMMRRRKTRRWSATIVALLCVLCAILFVALIYVIKFMN